MSDFNYLGYAVALCAGWGVVLLFVCLLCIASNRVSHAVIDSYGGWKVFLQFRDWYHENGIRGDK